MLKYVIKILKNNLRHEVLVKLANVYVNNECEEIGDH